MPNHCYTRISISDPTKKQKEILKKIEKAEGLCRYYKPMPKELEGTTSPQRVGDEENCTITLPKSIELKQKYGYDNWYDWCNFNWGTKWGCYDFYIEDDVIAFTSAWCPIGENIIRMFAKDFPSFHYEYEEEQGWGAEFDYEESECVLSNEYDAPQWEEVEDVDVKDESGYTICYTITKLCEDHPSYQDYGVGYYADYSHEFLGKTLKDAYDNLGVTKKLKVV